MNKVCPLQHTGSSADVGHAKDARDVGLKSGRVKPGLAGAAVVFLMWPFQIGSLWHFVHFEKVQRLLKKTQSYGRISKNS